MNLLAFDTSTERVFAAVQRGDARWRYQGAGGAQASGTLIAALLDLLAQADLALADLDALAFGRGPGSFTGLRTACAVAQGLAFGAALPVLPVDTLRAVAETARRQRPHATRVLALLDARMDQVYAAAQVWTEGAWHAASDMTVCAPEALALPDARAATGAHAQDGAPPPDWLLAGNVFATYGDRLPPPLRALPRAEALPTADALLDLAPALLQQGRAVAAQDALPLYIRDKVALTTAERLATRAGRP